MESIKLKLLEELMEHMSHLKGKSFKSMLDKEKMPKEIMGHEEEGLEGKKPDLALEKVEVMGKPANFDDKANDAIAEISKRPHSGKVMEEGENPEEDMSEEELEELLKRLA